MILCILRVSELSLTSHWHRSKDRLLCHGPGAPGTMARPAGPRGGSKPIRVCPPLAVGMRAGHKPDPAIYSDVVIQRNLAVPVQCNDMLFLRNGTTQHHATGENAMQRKAAPIGDSSPGRPGPGIQVRLDGPLGFRSALTRRTSGSQPAWGPVSGSRRDCRRPVRVHRLPRLGLAERPGSRASETRIRSPETRARQARVALPVFVPARARRDKIDFSSILLRRSVRSDKSTIARDSSRTTQLAIAQCNARRNQNPFGEIKIARDPSRASDSGRAAAGPGPRAGASPQTNATKPTARFRLPLVSVSFHGPARGRRPRDPCRRLQAEGRNWTERKQEKNSTDSKELWKTGMRLYGFHAFHGQEAVEN